MNVPDGGTPAETTSVAFDEWYDATYGKDYPNGTEFDTGEMWEAFRAGAAQAAAAQREADIKLARDYRVMVCLRRNDDGTVYYLHRKDFYPFADVLAAAPDTTTEGNTR